MSKLDHAASLTSSDAASTQKATLQQRTTNRKSINTGYNVLFLRRKVASPPRTTRKSDRPRASNRTVVSNLITGLHVVSEQTGLIARSDENRWE